MSVVRQAPVICVMAPPIHLGAWSMALMLWLPFELLLSFLKTVIICHTACLKNSSTRTKTSKG